MRRNRVVLDTPHLKDRYETVMHLFFDGACETASELYGFEFMKAKGTCKDIFLDRNGNECLLIQAGGNDYNLAIIEHYKK